MSIIDRLMADPGFRLKPEWLEGALTEWLKLNLDQYLAWNPHHTEVFVGKAEMHKFHALIADPGFRLKPEWLSEAIVGWLRHNLGLYLQENPQYIEMFVDETEYTREVVDATPFTAENAALIRRLITRVVSGTHKRPEYAASLVRKLAQAGMVAAIDDLPDHIWNISGCMALAAPYLSAEKVAELFKKVDWGSSANSLRWPGLHFMPVFAKINPDHLYLLVDRYRADGKSFIDNLRSINVVTISEICQSTPPHIGKKLIEEGIRQISESICMACGRHIEGDYAKHRQKCDPQDKYPSLRDLLARLHG
jgi:hypothetical protein